MGLIVRVLRHGVDCTNGGVSGSASELTVMNMDGSFRPAPERPAALLVANAMGNPILVPAELVGEEYVPLRPDGAVGPMFGGNYAATSDSRFSQAIRDRFDIDFYGALPVHDRFETPAQYEALSR